MERSRVDCIGEGGERQCDDASSELMTRNTNKRVESATPVLDRTLRKRIYSIVETMFSDNVKARKLLPDGSYAPVEREGEPLDAQDYFLHHVM